MLLCQFYANFNFVVAALLLLQVDGLVFALIDGFANLGWGLAQLGLSIGKESLSGAGGALGAMRVLKTAPQAGMA